MGKIVRNPFFWISVVLLTVNVFLFTAGEKTKKALQEQLFSKSALSIDSENLSKRVSKHENLIVPFSQKMITVDSIGQPVKKGVVTISPEIEGVFEWENAYSLRFVSKKGFPACSQYTITISSELEALSGDKCSEEQVLTFRTSPLEIKSINQDSATADTVILTLKFNDKVNADELRRHLCFFAVDDIQLDRDAIPYELEKGFIGNQIKVKLLDVDDGEYEASITEGLHGMSGPCETETVLSEKFKVSSRLKVRNINKDSYSGKRYVDIYFNQTVTADELRKHLQFEPEIKYSINKSSGSYFSVYADYESNQKYCVIIGEGVTAVNGRVSKEKYHNHITFGDYSSDLTFKNTGNYMQLGGSMLLPVETVNVKNVKLTLHRVHDNNIIHYLRDASNYSSGDESDYAQELLVNDYLVDNVQNEKITSYFDVKSLIKGKAGLYQVKARYNNTAWDTANTIILVSDIGITAKFSKNDVFVWANHISTSKALSNGEVVVYSRQNQVLAKGVTDADGVAHLIYDNIDGVPYAVIVKKDDDYALLTTRKTEIDTTNFDVNARPFLQKGYEAYVYSDRGIYRPGGTVHIQSLIREKGISFPGLFPVQIVVKDPIGDEFQEVTRMVSETGRTSLSVSLPDTARTGRYKVELIIPGTSEAIGSYTFLVEEFVPDTIKVNVTADKDSYKYGESVEVTVNAEYLFGAKAADLQGDLRYHVSARDFKHPEFIDYDFKNSGVSFKEYTRRNGSFTLDENGRSVIALSLPDKISTSTDLNVMLEANVKDEGGRAVTTSHTVLLNTQPFFIGIKRDREGYLIPGIDENFNICTINREGEVVTVPDKLLVTLYEEKWNWVMKEVNGRYRYEVEKDETEVLSFNHQGGLLRYSPPFSGTYRMEVTDKKTGVSSDIQFECYDAYESSVSKTRPDILGLTLDKKTYHVGDTAEVIVKSPFKGKGMLTVEADRVLSYIPFSMDSAIQKVSVPITGDFGKQFYFTVSVLKEHSSPSATATTRAFGVIPVTVDYSEYNLSVDVSAPEIICPGKELSLDLLVKDSSGKPAASELTVAVVDEGICQLTNFKTPSALEFFYSQRSLAISTYDIYSLLMPEIDSKKIGSDSVFGGGSASFAKRLYNPVKADRFKPVAMWSGTLRTGSDGRTSFRCIVPQHYSGKLRIMVVAAREKQFGQSESFAVARSPFTVKTTYPRFIAPGDTFSVPVKVFNQSGKDGTISIDIKGGRDEFKHSMKLKDGESHLIDMACKAPDVPGVVRYDIAVNGAGELMSTDVELSVRPPVSLHTTNGSGKIEATTTFSIADEWIDGTESVKLTFSPLPELVYADALNYVIDYPYGCLEQTTSKSFPLLYMGNIVRLISPELSKKDDLKAMVQHGIERILSMQRIDGGFSLWPDGETTYEWGSIYATHFLIEADNAGYSVNKKRMKRAVDYLKKLLRTGTEVDSREHRAYCLYTLALAGEPDRSWSLKLYEDIDELSGSSRAQIAVSLAKLGLTAEALSIFNGNMPDFEEVTKLGGTLSSPVRDAAVILLCYLDIVPDSDQVPLLVELLQSRLKDGRWRSTQENARALLAMGRYAQQFIRKDNNYVADIFVGDEKMTSVTHRSQRRLTPGDIAGKEIRVEMNGTGTLYYFWSVRGVPIKADIKEEDKRIKVRREIVSEDDLPADLENLKSGDIYFVKLSVSSDARFENIAISDLLPAGFEIENQNIASRQKFTSQIASTLKTDYVERRDDRMLVFCTTTPDEKVFVYPVRAVSRGNFVLPPVSAQCQYDEAIYSINGAGHIIVK